MKVACSPEALRGLPAAIYAPGKGIPSTYHGAPLDMVRQMASEMGKGISPTQAIQILLGALERYRRVRIGLPADLPEEDLAGIFVYALLDRRICRPMPEA